MSPRGDGVTGSGRRHGPFWSIEDIPYHALERDRVQGDERLFYILASASFIEITSHLYARNLATFFGGDGEVVDWLERSWEREELQHGAALKRYVETAWPDFDWHAAYRCFLADYAAYCTVDQLASTRALEMVARCVVETGTAGFYRMLADFSGEPVLGQLARAISADEVRHYKHFYRYFLRYRTVERPGRAAVLRTLWNRAAEVEAEDAFFAFKAIHLAQNPGDEFRASDYAAHRDSMLRLAKRHFPLTMAMKMLLKPLGLNATVGRALVRGMTSATRFVLPGDTTCH